MTQVKIAPSVLAADFGKLGEEIADIERSGAEILHIDVMDGAFVPPITFGDVMVSTAKRHSSLFLETHLMIIDPDRHLDRFAEAGSNRIIVHVESDAHCHRTLGSIRSLGVSPGISLNPGTPAESVYEVLDLCDLVLVMTVNPGWGGQSFITSSLEKIRKIRREIVRRGLSTVIEVDGGINEETAPRCVRAGAELLVAGSYVFGAPDRAERIRSLKRSIAGITQEEV
jgi:ribulose-phosphate 3-epimerase